MKRLGVLCILLLSLCVSYTLAQGNDRYFWETAGLFVRVPAGWAAPLPLEQNGVPILLLKPALIGAESAGGAAIQFKLLPAPDTLDLNALLQTEFEGLGLRLSVTQSLSWLNGEAVEAFGIDEAQTLYGRGRALVRPDGRVLMAMISGNLSEIDTLQSLFLDVIYGMTETDSDPGPRPYGLLWDLSSTGADGEQAFIQPQAMIVAGQTLYVADLLNGVLAFDALTGEFLWRQHVSPEAQVSALAVDASGVLYAADTGVCACIYRVTKTSAEMIGEGFGPQSPGSLVVNAEGRLLATDLSADGTVRVRVFEGGSERESLLFEIPLLSQPTLLTAPDHSVYAITDANELLKQEGAGFSLVTPLEIPVVINNSGQFGMSDQGLVVASSSEGAYRFDSTGQPTPVLFPLLPDEDLVAMALSPDGTIFTLYATPEQTRLTAWRSDTVAGGVGREILMPGRFVSGTSVTGRQQIWLIVGQEGDVIDFTALPINANESFIMSLRLIDAEGEILAEDTITSTPHPSVPIVLEEAGLYFLVTEHVNGVDTAYELGYSVPRTLLTEDQTVYGSLTQVLPTQRWIFEVEAGQTFTATVTPITGNLDPSLRLVNPRGTEVELNEDIDPTLGVDAGLMEIRLSNNGAYVLEVGASSGAGRYQLTIDIED